MPTQKLRELGYDLNYAELHFVMGIWIATPKNMMAGNPIAVPTASHNYLLLIGGTTQT